MRESSAMLTDKELRALKELALKAKPFRDKELTPVEEHKAQSQVNQELFVAVHSVLPELIDELLAYRNPRKKFSGITLIEMERRRQVEEEGFTDEHDDRWDRCQLALAALSYLEAKPAEALREPVAAKIPPYYWPWSPGFFKPRDRRSNLIRAGALLIAEQDRLSRLIARIAAALDELGNE